MPSEIFPKDGNDVECEKTIGEEFTPGFTPAKLKLLCY